MKIQFVIINFLILAALLFVFARKMVLSIFRTHKERVERELREIKEAEELVAPPATNFVPTQSDPTSAPEVESARAALEEKLSLISEYEARECHLLHHKMVQNARDGMFAMMKKHVAVLLGQEPWRSRAEERTPLLVEEILKQIKLTPGDKTYLKHHDVLYVTLTSAIPMSKELVDRVDRATKQLLAEVNGKTSLWVLVDPTMISGIKLRIGDTEIGRAHV